MISLAVERIALAPKLAELQEICQEVYGLGLADIAIEEFDRLHNIILCLSALEPVSYCECVDEESSSEEDHSDYLHCGCKIGQCDCIPF